MDQALPQQCCQGRKVDGQPLSGVGIFDGSANKFAIVTHPDVDDQGEVSIGCRGVGIRCAMVQFVCPFPVGHIW